MAAERPAEWGSRLTSDWWFKASDALLRRLMGFGAGDGPPQDQTQRLSQGLQIVFGAPSSDDFGERTVRSYLSAENESSDQLYVTLCDALVERCSPHLARQLAEAEGSGEEQASPSAAVSNTPSQGRRSPQASAAIVRPTPKGSPPNWWQSWIDKQNATFARERDSRIAIYQTCLEALTPHNVKAFTAIPAVQPGVEYWKGLFDQAVAISQLAIGIPRDELDDAYHVGELPKVPPNLRSYWLLGELVHAQWQFEYMHAEVFNDVLAEYLFSTGASPRSPRRLRGQFVDWRRMRRDPEYPDQIGAVQWAFGNWRPDIIDFTKNWIFEIKPLRTAHHGVLQLWRYCHNYNCAYYFDWFEKPGAQGTAMRMPLTPGPVSGQYFREVDPNSFLEEYFRSRDESRGAIPKSRQRASRSQIEGVLRGGGKIKVLPFPAATIPGLVLYYVLQDKDSKEPETPAPTVGNAVRIITGILIITAVLVAVVYFAPAIVAGATALAEGSATAAGALVTAQPVVEIFDVALKAQELEAATAQISITFSALNAAGVL